MLIKRHESNFFAHWQKENKIFVSCVYVIFLFDCSLQQLQLFNNKLLAIFIDLIIYASTI